MQIKQMEKMKVGGKIMATVGGVLGSSIIIMGLLLWVKSPGKIEPYRDEKGEILEGSLSSKEFVEINGTKMGMFIRSKDVNKPVLLFLHGGIGMPEYFLNHDYPNELDELFTVVWWEQRGAGLSYDSKLKPEEITTEQMVLDIIELSKYLCERFGKEKIYLMGHSAGTYAGILAAQKAPKLYEAYIGMAQIVNQSCSEDLACHYMKKYYANKGQEDKVSKLEKYYGTKKYRGMMRDSYMHEAGIGTARNMKSVITGIFLPVMTAPEYTIAEKINIWRGKALGSESAVQKDERKVDLTQKVLKLEIPVYFFSGLYDYTVNYEMSKDYLKQLDAPVKGFYLFEESAHSPIFEEPQKARFILEEDVINGKNDLATCY